jgi:hypothetical protein
MTSQQGTFEYFDYEAWQRTRCVQKHAHTFSYPPNTLMAYLQAHFPRFAQIVTQAKYDARFADESTGFTLFLSSEWETKSAAEIDRMPVHECKLIVTTNTMTGRLRREDLLTSRSSQLFPINTSATLRVWFEHNELFKDGEVIVDDKTFSNGIIHFLRPNPQNRCGSKEFLP